jgi:hypothetical protein
MDLLERYLQAIRVLLQGPHQEDIIRELRENLTSQVEDREEELGRSLTQDEYADILRRHGHPVAVAGRYGPPTYLIGPTFFPLYLFALKAGLAVAFLIAVIVAIVTAAMHGDPVRSAIQAFLAFPGRALTVFAWTTLGFAALDFALSRMKLTCSWDPRKLPKVIRPEYRISRVNCTFELIFTVAFLTYLLAIPGAPHLVLGPAAAIFVPAPTWSAIYVPFLVVTMATAVSSLIDLIRPYWTPGRSLLRIAISSASLALLAVLLRAGEWVVAKPAATLPGGASLERLLEVINQSLGIGLRFACAVALVEIVAEVLRLRARRGRFPATNSSPASVGH